MCSYYGLRVCSKTNKLIKIESKVVFSHGVCLHFAGDPFSLRMIADATELNVSVLEFFVVSSIVDGNFEFANRNISSSVIKP